MNILATIKAGLLVTLILFLTIGKTQAHTENEQTLFPDLKSSEARFDVILLVSVGVIPETDNFHPDNRLTRLELAAWGALAHNLAEVSDKPDINALAISAKNTGLIDSIEGNASFSDINDVIFDGQLTLEMSETNPNRAEAASYIAANLNSGTYGETLLDHKGMRFGPTGEVSKVESRMNPDGGTSYFITVANQTYPLYTHAKVANGPTDLKQWQKREVRRSIIRSLGQINLWVFLEADEPSHSTHEHSK